MLCHLNISFLTSSIYCCFLCEFNVNKGSFSFTSARGISHLKSSRTYLQVGINQSSAYSDIFSQLKRMRAYM